MFLMLQDMPVLCRRYSCELPLYSVFCYSVPMGPDYTQWHGAYEIEKALVNLKDMADQMLKQAQGGK